MNSITLISCVGKKQSHSCPAQDLYQSTWFLKARAYVERQQWDWYILSAKHGFLHRDKIIEPYNQTLNKMPIFERKLWAEQVFADICQVLPKESLIKIFAGLKYREFLVPCLKQIGYTVEIPLEPLKIGQQLAWFNFH
ncbi:MAG: hypothetical protein EA343_08015 [Nodularia sp. (in: Bacteria)]|nr:MAG: hypothetical protein EA343_08015 [Nodularia sp. (in: cyanobacteria)]